MSRCTIGVKLLKSFKFEMAFVPLEANGGVSEIFPGGFHVPTTRL